MMLVAPHLAENHGTPLFIWRYLQRLNGKVSMKRPAQGWAFLIGSQSYD
jgi:hypothetical protein